MLLRTGRDRCWKRLWTGLFFSTCRPEDSCTGRFTPPDRGIHPLPDRTNKIISFFVFIRADKLGRAGHSFRQRGNAAKKPCRPEGTIHKTLSFTESAGGASLRKHEAPERSALSGFVERFFACPTPRAYPVIRDVFPFRAGFDAVFRVSRFFIVNITAGRTDVHFHDDSFPSNIPLPVRFA